MNVNEIYKKLETVGMYIFSFFFWYLVIAFFLKSEYPIYDYSFNRNIAYEVLRDGLTLSAYFLAPAVVIVAFTDWREQYKEIALEKNTQESYKFLNDSFKALLDFKYEICKGEKMDEERCLGVIGTKDRVLHLIDFAERSLNLVDDKVDVNQFKTKSKEIAGLLKSCLTKLHGLDIEYQNSKTVYSPNFLFADCQINEINERLNILSTVLTSYKV